MFTGISLFSDLKTDKGFSSAIWLYTWLTAFSWVILKREIPIRGINIAADSALSWSIIVLFSLEFSSIELSTLELVTSSETWNSREDFSWIEEVQTFAKSLESQLQAMTAEYQQSVQEYQANEASYTDLVKQDKVTEITGLEQRIQAFQQNANEALISKEKELLEPILQKARQASEDVANEGDYTYICDKSFGSILYVKESENILEKVKKKLKL